MYKNILNKHQLGVQTFATNYKHIFVNLKGPDIIGVGNSSTLFLVLRCLILTQPADIASSDSRARAYYIQKSQNMCLSQRMACPIYVAQIC